MTMTATSILPALVKAVRPFAFRGRRGPLALRDALVRHDGGSTSVTATDLEIACTITACEAGRDNGLFLVDAACGVPVGDDHDPAEFPAVYRLDGSPVATFAMSLRDLRRVADHVASVTDTETSRYALGGVLLENPVAGVATFVGTNGRRLHAAAVQTYNGEGDVPVNTIIPGRLFPAAVKAVKAAAALAGIKGRAVDALPVVVTVTGTAVEFAWGTETVFVAARGCLVQGRFPRWRECLRDFDGGTDSTAPAERLAADCRAIVAATKVVADRRADAYVAQMAAAGKRVARGAYQHPRGVQFSPEGLSADGCEYSRPIALSATVKLDPAYVADALDAAADFAGCDEVTIRATDATTAVYLPAGDLMSGGTGFLAIVMPMAAE
jgi:hypothetical protein